jgi:signal transduction histidine kinase
MLQWVEVPIFDRPDGLRPILAQRLFGTIPLPNRPDDAAMRSEAEKLMFQTQKRITRRFFMAFMLIAVIPIVVMGYETYVLERKALTSSAFLHMSTIVKDHARHLDAWLKERLDDIAVLSRLPVIVETCEEYSRLPDADRTSQRLARLLKDTLATTQKRSPSYENIAILSPKGEVLASNSSLAEDVSGFGDLQVIERLSKGEEPVFGPVFRHEDQRWRLHLASKIRDQESRPVGIVLAVLDVSTTLDPFMMDRIGLGETGETYLANKDGQIITESRFLKPSETQNRSFDTPGIRSALKREDGTAVYKNYMGREVLGSYLWVPSHEWAILAEIETDEILKPLKWIKIVGLLSGLGVTLVCIVMAYVVSQRVSKPIIQIAEAAHEIAGGRFDHRIPFSSGDEIGGLAMSFNTMAQQLSRLIATLRHKEVSLQKAYDDLVAAQEQLVQSEKMAAIGELVASVAHEMRNPLSSVKLNVQIIGRALNKETVLFEHFQIARDQVAQLEAMLSDLLNYSKPLILQKTEVRMQNALEAGLQQLEGEIEAQGVRILKTTAEGLPTVDADFDKVVQVLVNIIKNAMEASGRNGRIEVMMDQGELAGKNVVVVTVTDHGKGIPQRNLEALFRPFFTTKQKGTGLGLSIVRKIMDAHRGDITITSDVERGTTVTLTFPCAKGTS